MAVPNVVENKPATVLVRKSATDIAEASMTNTRNAVSPVRPLTPLLP
jgi:hypothetical protein